MNEDRRHVLKSVKYIMNREYIMNPLKQCALMVTESSQQDCLFRIVCSNESVPKIAVFCPLLDEEFFHS